MNDIKQAAAGRSVTVWGSVVKHQMRVFLDKLGVEWTVETNDQLGMARFEVPEATDEQWAQIQAWVGRVTA